MIDSHPRMVCSQPNFSFSTTYSFLEGGERATEESSTREVDPIISIIQAYPEGDTTPPDPKTPLTEKELESTSFVKLATKLFERC